MGDETWRSSAKFMSISTARVLAGRIREHALKHDLRHLCIGLHGGEPLLIGPSRLDALASTFRTELASFKTYISLQTNGTLLNKEFCSVISAQDISLGVSIDGFPEANNRRIDLRGRPSFSSTIRGIELAKTLIPDQVGGVLAVINPASDPLAVFDFMADLGINRVDFLLPHHHWDLLPPRTFGRTHEYGEWLWKVFQAWVNGRHTHLGIRFFENIIRQYLRVESKFEAMNLAPVTLVTINTDGDIEGVDTLKSTASGIQRTGLSVHSNSIDEALTLDLIALRQSGRLQLSDVCQRCKYVRECAGGYFPHRFSRDRKFNNPSVYCGDLFWLLTKIDNYLGGVSRQATSQAGVPQH